MKRITYIIPIIVCLFIAGCGKEKMGQRTHQAWQALQNVDYQLSQMQHQLPSRRLSQQAYLYSSIDTSGIDPILREHFEQSIAACQKASELFSKIEIKIAEVGNRTEAAAELGALFGSAVSDGYNPQGDAAAGALLFGLFGAASQQAEKDRILAKYNNRMNQAIAELERIANQDKEVAEQLSKKYDISFHDPF